MDARLYKRAKNRSRSTIVADPDNGDTAVLITIGYYDRETGSTEDREFRTTRDEINARLTATQQDRNALNNLLTDIEAIVGVTPV